MVCNGNRWAITAEIPLWKAAIRRKMVGNALFIFAVTLGDSELTVQFVHDLYDKRLNRPSTIRELPDM